jgi:hypothetical protein
VVDLPFFFNRRESDHSDNAEIISGLRQLLWSAYQLEAQVFGDIVDLDLKIHGFKG